MQFAKTCLSVLPLGFAHPEWSKSFKERIANIVTAVVVQVLDSSCLYLSGTVFLRGFAKLNNSLKNNMPGPGIEPRPTTYQSDV